MQLRTVLSAIKAPSSQANLIASGRISDLAISPEGRARFVLDAGNNSDSEVNTLLASVKTAMLAIDGVTDVQAIATRHAAPASRVGMTTTNAHQNPLGLKDFMGKNKSAKKDRIDESKKALADIGKVIAIASGKGGVGKSTLTVNLAMALQKQGLSVGILDCDVYGPSLPTLLNLSDKPTMKDGKIQPVIAHGMKTMSIGLLVNTEKAVAWRGPMVMGAVRQMINDVDWGELDILLIDTPPGTGDAHLTLIQTGLLDGTVIVSTPQEMALADVRRGISLFRQTNIPVLGLIENMSWLELPDGSKQFIFGEGGGKRMAQTLGIPLLGEIPLEPAIASASDAGLPFLVNQHTSKAAQALQEIASKIQSGFHE